MPFDGVVMKCVALELNKELVGGRIEKIYQPMRDEVILHMRSNSGQRKLLLSANPSNPRIHFTASTGPNPDKPPMFCMLLRKYISSGIIRNVISHDYERILEIYIESMNEMGDIVLRRLIIEIMGRTSNIMLINESGLIIDSIRHVDFEMSRVREVMPGREYSLPPTQDKVSPEQLDINELMENTVSSRTRIEKFLLEQIKGFSPLLCRMLCQDAGLYDNPPLESLSSDEITALSSSLERVVKILKSNRFMPYLLFDSSISSGTGAFNSVNTTGMIPLDYHCVEFKDNANVKFFSTINEVLDLFYSAKDVSSKLEQKKAAILKKLNTALQKCERKAYLQQSDIEESKNMDELKLFGELITANIHSIPEMVSTVSLQNYYDADSAYIDIPLDKNLSPQKNAQKYFKKYNKAKSTFEHASENLKRTQAEMDYVESLIYQTESCESLQELAELNDELASAGFITQPKGKSSKQDEPSMPLHFVSSDGVDIYIGRNNRQNDLLTFKHAFKEDTWLHAKNIPGSHVIIHGKGKIPDRTIAEAAELAAYHSKFKNSANVPVDITKVKDVRKPKGFKPGLVLYDNLRTVYVTPREETVNRLRG